ncbi:hypothetical protein [Flavobacterium undicola]|uniref:hypothetical protein n=1 Tax=Flavobacterium undicola TaxID=1932779 RepID=UPI001377A098|nr:hypothetical protein [Flavobacterium undicola]MBA0883849.1 hypothetical protein [Flavobacterium undicola]
MTAIDFANIQEDLIKIRNKIFETHKVFKQLKDISEFYDGLSFATIGAITLGVKNHINLDKQTFTSIKGTLESIQHVLHKGRVNDAYSLLRKYYDVTIINIYIILFIEDSFKSGKIDGLIVKDIENWRNGTKKLPRSGTIFKYVQESEILKEITSVLKKDERYDNIRDRCNDNTHYNYYLNMCLNNEEDIEHDYRIKLLDAFSEDLVTIFIQHFSYLFSLKQEYMAASNYIDCLELGLTPEEDSQYWVAPFVQEIFDKYIKTNRLDLSEEIILRTSMKLE